MKYILLNFILIQLSFAVLYSKLSTKAQLQLLPRDYIVSTLGLFRFSLISQSCFLSIQSFGTSSYSTVGTYQIGSGIDCDHLIIGNRSVLNSNNEELLKITDFKNSVISCCRQTLLTIDDMGIIRLTGIGEQDYQTIQNMISIFRTPQQFIYSTSNFVTSNLDSLPFVQNNGKWGFSASQGQFRLFHVDNGNSASNVVRYNYSSFTIIPNNLLDSNSYKAPLFNIRNVKYQPRCDNTQELTYEGPFVFVIHPFWPEFRLLDHKGYQILSIRYPSLNCVNNAGIDIVKGEDDCVSWFCPQNLFQFNGSCVASCPSPFYSQIHAYTKNRCVLFCEAGFEMDNVSRICSCTTHQKIKCPVTLGSAPLTCLCKNKTFFNPLNLVCGQSNASQVCQSNCGPNYFEHREGTCVKCPRFCKYCSLSNNSISYLACNTCEQNYILDKGICIRACSFFIGRYSSSNGSCLQCNVKNCKNCSLSPNQCSECVKPWALLNNTCLRQCPFEFKLVFSKYQGFKCQAVDLCPNNNVVSTCMNCANLNNICFQNCLKAYPFSNLLYSNQSSCFCMKNSSNYGFNQNCGIENTCPQLMKYFENTSKSCISCPIGCLICFSDSFNQIECSGCNPEFILYVDGSNNHYCQRISFLSICNRDFNKSAQTCIAKNVEAIVNNISSRNLCKANLPYCLICLYGSSSVCTFCLSGYFLSLGKCYSQCPSNKFQYSFQSICLQRQIPNCKEQIIINVNYLLNIDMDTQYISGYQYLVSSDLIIPNILNDPIGAAYSYFTMLNRKLSGDKLTKIIDASSTCTACQVGFGINRYGKCSKCKKECSKCVYSDSDQCIACDIFHKLNNASICVPLPIDQMPCIDGQFRNQSKMCEAACPYFYRIYSNSSQNSSFVVNCTYNCPDLSKIYLNSVNNASIATCDSSNLSQSASQTITFFGSKVEIGNGAIYFFIPSMKLTQISNASISLKAINSNRILQQQNPASYSIVTAPDKLIILDSNGLLNNTPVIAYFQVSSIFSEDSSSNKIFLGNSVYGISQKDDYLQKIYNQSSNLYVYGRVYSVILLIVAIIFMGNQLNYKTDNVFITFSFIYLILPSLNVNMKRGGIYVYSFLYGFSWSAELQFLSSSQFVTNSLKWLNPNYLQNANNNAHYVFFIDNNIIRNGWSIFLTLIIIIAFWVLIVCICKFLSAKVEDTSSICWIFDKIRCCMKRQYTDINRNIFASINSFTLLMIENSFMGLSFYCVNQLRNDPWILASSSDQSGYRVLAGFLIGIIAAFSFIRFYLNRIAGLYCFKRMLLGLFLGFICSFGGVDQNLAASIVTLICIQLVFTFFRVKLQFYDGGDEILKMFGFNKVEQTHDQMAVSPMFEQRKTQKSQTINQIQELQQKQLRYLLIQQALITLVYGLMVSVNTLMQISIILVWLIINVFMIFLLLDLFEEVLLLYSKSYNLYDKFYKIQNISGLRYKKIRNAWDHSINQKSYLSIISEE